MSDYNLKVSLPKIPVPFSLCGRSELLFPNILIQTGDDNDYSIINIEEMELLKKNKNQIDSIYDSKEWDTAKKITNPYELVYVSSRKSKIKSMAKYEPLSRSYFKLWEILHDYFLNPKYEDNYKLITNKNKIKIAHIAEGPGGFMEAIINLRKKYLMDNHNIEDLQDDIYGITLRSTDKEIPGWKKATNFLRKHKNITITYGHDGTGNIYNTENIKFFQNRVGYNSVDLITADGGFDFSIDFNRQEFLAQRLIFCELVTAMSVQKVGGCFICKFFDTYSLLTIKFIYILQCFYREVHINKPLTSRPANSEKYIVACQFKGINNATLTQLYDVIDQWEQVDNYGKNIVEIFEGTIPEEFIQEIKKYNTKSAHGQIEYITKTLSQVKNNNKPQIYNIMKQQKINAMEWCQKYNVERNII